MGTEILKERKVYKKRTCWKKWKKAQNRQLHGMSKADRMLFIKFRRNPSIKNITLNAPKIFSTVLDLDAVVEFVNECKNMNMSLHNAVYLNFRRVLKVNAGALALILSVINDLAELKVQIYGNKPLNSEARKSFNLSGIMNHFVDGRGRKRRNGLNEILIGRGKTRQEETARVTAFAMLTVFDRPIFNPPIQTALVEMMANSVNHAFTPGNHSISSYLEQLLSDKKWYLSTLHDLEKKCVHFTFVDNGVGLIKTIRRGIHRILVDALDDTKVLENAFNGEYRSRTGKAERGTGLKSIKEVYLRKVVKELKVVTNNQLYDFETQAGTKLSNNFEGTAYFWTLDINCFNGYTQN